MKPAGSMGVKDMVAEAGGNEGGGADKVGSKKSIL